MHAILNLHPMCDRDFTCTQPGMINVDQTQMEVDESIGNFNVCVTTDEELCLNVTSQDDDAGVFISQSKKCFEYKTSMEIFWYLHVNCMLFPHCHPEEDEDYRAVSNVSAVSTGSKWCIEIAIINDNRSEPDENFTVKFSKVNGQCGMNGGSGGSGDNSGMLQPVPNEIVVITIKDDDDDDDDIKDDDDDDDDIKDDDNDDDDDDDDDDIKDDDEDDNNDIKDDNLGTYSIHSTACGMESLNKSKMKVYNVVFSRSLTSIEKTFLCLISV